MEFTERPSILRQSKYATSEILEAVNQTKTNGKAIVIPVGEHKPGSMAQALRSSLSRDGWVLRTRMVPDGVIAWFEKAARKKPVKTS